uniref:Uncharacterized protein n=1 Tax=Cacopsylla melanoneura TaxID=428564 RepID=A0A8D8XEU0_9HEMI
MIPISALRPCPSLQPVALSPLGGVVPSSGSLVLQPCLRALSFCLFGQTSPSFRPWHNVGSCAPLFLTILVSLPGCLPQLQGLPLSRKPLLRPRGSVAWRSGPRSWRTSCLKF